MRFTLLFLVGLWQIIFCAARIALLWLIGLCAVLGAVAAVDALTFRPLPRITRQWAEPETTECRPPSHAESLVMTNRQRYERMKRPMELLMSVCLPVPMWVHERYESGHLVFETRDRGRYAAWRPSTGTLIVNLMALESSDLELACTLAHEFRHSRQGLLPVVQQMVRGFCGVRYSYRDDPCEQEAFEFEGQVRRALKGQEP